MSYPVIRVEDISKQYRLGLIGTGTLSHDLNRLWYKIRGKQDPYIKIGDDNDRTSRTASEYVWALKNISFEIQRGDVVGIIGRNGAGKSTLLKILSRTTLPTTGAIKIKGRIASLLEVGTGFHPELTGRENVFLNGAILGMRKNEIKRKFDEIIAFSGVEKYVDTPVKRYSSGMYVRLAFAVAAHLDPEILIVDEVLAVGDSEFQSKALGKMKDVSAGQGRTVLFVSHNMAAIRKLCEKAVLLNNGRIETIGNAIETTDAYRNLNEASSSNLQEFNKREGSGACRLIDIKVGTIAGGSSVAFQLGDKLYFKLGLQKLISGDLRKLRVIIGVYNSLDEGYLRLDTKNADVNFAVEKDFILLRCDLLDHLNIKPDLYYVNVAIFQDDSLCDYVTNVLKFSLQNLDYFGTGRGIENPELSKVFYKHIWKIEN